MTDATLLIIGCAVTFTACAGAYVAIRARFDESHAPRTQTVKARGAGPIQAKSKSNAA